MRLVSIKQCRPGMRLGKTIFNEEGLVLLSENMELTTGLIARLEQFGMTFVYVRDARTDDIVVKDLVSAETRARAVGEIRSNFRRVLDEAGKKRSVIPYIGKAFRNLMNSIIDDVSNNKDAMIMLMNLSVADNYLYQHSLNVCIYSTMLGIAHGYDRDQLMTLGLGALLHDIGKVHIPVEILNKPGNLTNDEFELMKKHTEFGFQFLKDEPNVPLLSAHCAFQHHERINGSGYPRGIKGNDIHEYARWIGVVDSYDAMTTNRVYRKAMLPHQALEVLYTGVGTLYDQEKVKLFRDKVAIYPLGIEVTLSTGEVGVVVDVNSAYPQRPVVRVLTGADGQEVLEPYELDLSKRLNLVISGVGGVEV